MTNYKTITPGVVGIYVDSRKESEVACTTMKAMLELLSSTNRVYLRRAPTWTKNMDFESEKEEWFVTCRFMVVPGEPGLIEPNRTFDDENMLTGFGLPTINDNNSSQHGS